MTKLMFQYTAIDITLNLLCFQKKCCSILIMKLCSYCKSYFQIHITIRSLHSDSKIQTEIACKPLTQTSSYAEVLKINFKHTFSSYWCKHKKQKSDVYEMCYVSMHSKKTNLRKMQIWNEQLITTLKVVFL